MVCVRSSAARLQPAKMAMVVTSSMTTKLSDIADDVLLSNIKALVKSGRAVTAELLLHLGEVDARRLYLGLAYPSLFAWCVGALGFSEDSAYHHIGVARLARRLPAVLEFLREGKVHLAGLRLLAPHLTETNHTQLLEEASGKSKRTIEELVARLAPKPRVADSIRRLPKPAVALPAASPGASLAASPGGAPAPVMEAAPTSVEAASTPPALLVLTPPPPARVTPLAEETYGVHFTACRRLRDKLREAQGLVEGDLASVVEKAVDLLLTDARKKRFAVGCKPRASTPAHVEAAAPLRVVTDSRHVPSALERAVYERDGGRCTFE